MHFRVVQPKLLFIKVFIIFALVFIVAYFTQNMVYELPTLAISVFAGNSLKQNEAEEGVKAKFKTND